MFPNYVFQFTELNFLATYNFIECKSEKSILAYITHLLSYVWWRWFGGFAFQLVFAYISILFDKLKWLKFYIFISIM